MNTRTTYQTILVADVTKQLKHATNLQILLEVKKQLPDISATTVHRITQRLVNKNVLAYGPEVNGSIIIDSNPQCHDHFICNKCFYIEDIKFNKEIKNIIIKNISVKNNCKSITVHGVCDKC